MTGAGADSRKGSHYVDPRKGSQHVDPNKGSPYKDKLSRAAHRRLRSMLAAHIIWVATVFVLGAWWGRFILEQARSIAELERAVGRPITEIDAHWARVQRMLYWESSAFFLLLLAMTGALIWMYWRDVRRARSLQAFFASVTHELRTPLTSIRLQAESLAESLEGDGADPAARSLVDRLLQDTQRLEGQVDRTLELARVEGGGPVLLQSVALKPHIEMLARNWREAYRGRMEFRADGIAEDTVIEADPAAVGVILRNLVENSLRHARREPVTVTLRTEMRPGAVVLVFRDDGEGFQGDLRYLGQVFHRGSNSQGTGVGLYLIQALMDQMGGSVRLASEQGFEVALRFREGATHVG